MGDFKVIETRYKGYRFRSRTEARWAVFFDSLGLKYEYEKEGYELASGRYLPDFYLPDIDCWIEIKGPAASLSEQTLARELHEDTGSIVCIFSGLPEIDEPAICFAHDSSDSSAGLGQWDDVAWAVCEGCNQVQLTLGKDTEYRAIMRADWESWKGSCACPNLWNRSHTRIKAACLAAKQARFEHGEKGL